MALSSKKPGLLRCKVIDTGIGIESEVCLKLFRPFVRSQDRKGLNRNGCGLGLAISKSLSERLGGSIKVKSQLDVGSRFIFKIKTNLDISEEERLRLHTPYPRSPNLYEPNTGLGVGSESVSGMNSKSILALENIFQAPKSCSCTKVLCVDDDKFCRSLMINLLKKLKVPADEVLNS